MRRSLPVVFVVLLTGFTGGNNAFSAGWVDDFESYPAAAFPGSVWTNSGNTENFIETSMSVSGGQSFYFFGRTEIVWASLAHRQLDTSAPFLIEFNLFNGSEQLFGHHTYGKVSLHSGPFFGTSNRRLIDFRDDNTMLGSGSEAGGEGPDLGTYLSETWYAVKIRYEVVDPTSVQIGYWVDGAFKGSYLLPAFAHEGDLAYLTISGEGGSAWFDDVRITAVPEPTSVVLVTSIAGLLVARRNRIFACCANGDGGL